MELLASVTSVINKESNFILKKKLYKKEERETEKIYYLYIHIHYFFLKKKFVNIKI